MAVEEIDQAELLRLSFDYRDRTTVLARAVVVTPRTLASDVVESMKEGLPQSDEYRIDAQMLYILSDTFTSPQQDIVSSKDVPPPSVESLGGEPDTRAEPETGGSKPKETNYSDVQRVE